MWTVLIDILHWLGGGEEKKQLFKLASNLAPESIKFFNVLLTMHRSISV
jgi:hypothetical protein